MTVKKFKKLMPETYQSALDTLGKAVEKLQAKDVELTAANDKHKPRVYEITESNSFIFILENGRRISALNVNTMVKNLRNRAIKDKLIA